MSQIGPLTKVCPSLRAGVPGARPCGPWAETLAFTQRGHSYAELPTVGGSVPATGRKQSSSISGTSAKLGLSSPRWSQGGGQTTGPSVASIVGGLGHSRPTGALGKDAGFLGHKDGRGPMRDWEASRQLLWPRPHPQTHSLGPGSRGASPPYHPLTAWPADLGLTTPQVLFQQQQPRNLGVG